MHSANVDGVGVQAEAELFVWPVQRSCLAEQKKFTAATITLGFPPVKPLDYRLKVKAVLLNSTLFNLSIEQN